MADKSTQNKKKFSFLAPYFLNLCHLKPPSLFIPSEIYLLLNLIFSTFSASKEAPQEEETINIFSVASGHLYERFLRIMMLSVIKHTKSPVKFWFLKNYLSPILKVMTALLGYTETYSSHAYVLKVSLSHFRMNLGKPERISQ